MPIDTHPQPKKKKPPVYTLQSTGEQKEGVYNPTKKRYESPFKPEETRASAQIMKERESEKVDRELIRQDPKRTENLRAFEKMESDKAAAKQKEQFMQQYGMNSLPEDTKFHPSVAEQRYIQRDEYGNELINIPMEQALQMGMVQGQTGEQEASKMVEMGLLAAGSAPGALGAVSSQISRTINLGKSGEITVGEQALQANSLRGKIKNVLGKNKLIQTTLGTVVSLFGLNKIIGSADRETSDIESAVGKMGERIAKRLDLANNGYDPVAIYGEMLDMEDALAAYEERLHVLKERNPELVLNPAAMDSAYAEIEKIRAELDAAKQKMKVYAVNPVPENVELLALAYDELEKEK